MPTDGHVVYTVLYFVVNHNHYLVSMEAEGPGLSTLLSIRAKTLRL